MDIMQQGYYVRTSDLMCGGVCLRWYRKRAMPGISPNQRGRRTMEFQSTGLGQRHLDIRWQAEVAKLSTERAQDVWGAVLRDVPLWLLEQSGQRVVVLRGETR